jgi:hypothetical protein
VRINATGTEAFQRCTADARNAPSYGPVTRSRGPGDRATRQRIRADTGWSLTCAGMASVPLAPAPIIGALRVPGVSISLSCPLIEVNRPLLLQRSNVGK